MPSSQVMREWKAGRLHSVSRKGPKVRSRKQAVAIKLAMERREGKRVPRRGGKSR